MKRRVLIVEDNERTRCSIETFIRENRNYADACVFHADNGMVAWSSIRTYNPQVMFLDMEMPGMNGIELLQKMSEAGCKVHVVIASGYSSYEYTRKAIQYGAVDYLLKPVDRKEVSHILDKLALKVSDEPTAQQLDPGGNAGIEEIKSYINEHFTEALTLSALAEQFHYNNSYLSREFKTIYGTGITEYINNVRLERARVLLGQGMPVHKVCETVGYNDDSYFSRLFKKAYGLSPKQYSMN